MLSTVGPPFENAYLCLNVHPNVLSPQGMKRVFDDMPDICLDVPAAYSLLEQLGGQLYQHGCFPEALYKEMPARWVRWVQGFLA